LEFVDGDTLAERIARGRVPVEEALEIARQLAEALEAAHAKGVVHRDLKPANIKVTRDGKVKVLDFGLAKIFESEVALPDMPTRRAVSTEDHVILGTVGYMSPEQARGKDVDKRTDKAYRHLGLGVRAGDIGDARIEINDAMSGPFSTTIASTGPVVMRYRILLMTATLLILALAIPVARYFMRPADT
jgi:serine/threonine protein kinase